MGNSESSEDNSQPDQQVGVFISEIKALLSNGDEKRAFDDLMKRARAGNAMACYDCGFMMIQGIGCERDWREGMELVKKGHVLAEKKKNENWKKQGSVTDVIEPQTVNLRSLFFV